MCIMMCQTWSSCTGARIYLSPSSTTSISWSPDFTTYNPDQRTPNLNAPQYWAGTFNNPGNEPTELIVFLFNRAGAPWLTDKWLLNEEHAYKVGPDGVPGDDDVGQLSAWYVTAASGLVQSCPGDPASISSPRSSTR